MIGAKQCDNVKGIALSNEPIENYHIIVLYLPEVSVTQW